jgi:tRNA(Ile)-lysidine synthase TilS/MesJ
MADCEGGCECSDPKPKFTRGLCKKCKTQSGKFVIRNNLSCAQCFIEFMEHRFRTALRAGLDELIGENTLVCISGGGNSTVMTHLIYKSLANYRIKKLIVNPPKVLYVDDSVVYGTPVERVNEFREYLTSRYEFSVDTVKIEDEYPDISNLLIQRSERGSHREDLISDCIQNIILKYAQQRGYSKVLTGHSGSRIASCILADVCKGKGASISDWSLLKLHREEIQLIRPMREFLTKETELYIHLESISTLPKLPLANVTTLPGLGSIDLLIEDFLLNLQDKFPSTTHTILRTVSKLSK